MHHALSPEAELELDRIWDYVATQSGSLEAADRLIDSLTRRIYLFGLNPYIGRCRDEDLKPGMRSFPVGEYIILYQVNQDFVSILHVVRASRDVELLFGQ